MPSWGAVAYGVALSVVVAVVAVRLLLRERRLDVLAASGVATGLGPLLWDLILRHTGGRFFTDAPGLVFPVSYEDTGSGVFATALAALVLGFGPMRAASGGQLASTAAVCGVAALLVDIYLY
jgi:hypothetical protein